MASDELIKAVLRANGGNVQNTVDILSAAPGDRARFASEREDDDDDMDDRPSQRQRVDPAESWLAGEVGGVDDSAQAQPEAAFDLLLALGGRMPIDVLRQVMMEMEPRTINSLCRAGKPPSGTSDAVVPVYESFKQICEDQAFRDEYNQKWFVKVFILTGAVFFRMMAREGENRLKITVPNTYTVSQLRGAINRKYKFDRIREADMGLRFRGGIQYFTAQSSVGGIQLYEKKASNRASWPTLFIHLEDERFNPYSRTTTTSHFTEDGTLIKVSRL